MAAAREWRVLKVFSDDGVSGERMDNRANLLEALALLKRREAQILLVADLSRLTRSIRDLLAVLEVLERKSAALVAVREGLDTSTSMGRMLSKLLAVIAEWQRDETVFRFKTAAAERKAKLRPYGPQKPYGVREEGGRLVADLEKLEVVKRILLWRATGQTLTEIANRLNGEGAPTMKGGRWHPETVRSIAANDIYGKFLDEEAKP
jgi:site-specific DNA recombinase